MNMTDALKSWLITNCGVSKDAGNEEFSKAASDALLSGKLSGKQYAELTASKSAREANEFSAKLDRIADGLSKAVDLLTPKAEDKPEVKEDKPAPTMTKEVKPTSFMAKALSMGGSVEDDGGTPKEAAVRVKEAVEQYNDTKSALHYPTHTKNGNGHPFAGQRVTDYSEKGRALNTPSERDFAIAGAYGKFLCAHAMKRSRNLAWAGMRDHEKELILHAMQEMEWGGASDGGDYHDIDRRKLTNLEQKAIIDDAVSGGIEAVPIVFDDMIVSTPILQGELFPLVNLVPLDKGRRIQGARAGIVTSEWGGVDDTSITLFDTASYVSAFDTTIYRWQGSIWIGLDFLSDTPVDFGAFLTTQYGEVMLRSMDDVVATGNGTTQPEGVMTKSGTGSVTFGGVHTLGAWESLRFGVHKREHLPNLVKSAVFCGTDVTYQRTMAIPVSATDARRLSSVQQLANYDGYSWMNRPFKINESLTNAQAFYAILGRYRMYRRRGLTIRNSVEGDTLIRRNEMLMTATARFGGQLERGACAAVSSDLPA